VFDKSIDEAYNAEDKKGRQGLRVKANPNNHKNLNADY